MEEVKKDSIYNCSKHLINEKTDDKNIIHNDNEFDILVDECYIFDPIDEKEFNTIGYDENDCILEEINNI